MDIVRLNRLFELQDILMVSWLSAQKRSDPQRMEVLDSGLRVIEDGILAILRAES